MSAVKFSSRVESSRPTASGKIENRRVGRIESGGEALPLPRLSSRRWPPLRWPTGRPEPSFRGSPLIRGKFADTDNRLIAAAMETYHVPMKLG